MNKEDKELEKRFTEYYHNFDLYMEKYVVPEVYASQLASRFYRNLITNESLIIIARTIGEVFNINFKFEDVRKEVDKILKIKYNLVIKNEDPLIIENIIKK